MGKLRKREKKVLQRLAKSKMHRTHGEAYGVDSRISRAWARSKTETIAKVRNYNTNQY